MQGARGPDPRRLSSPLPFQSLRCLFRCGYRHHASDHIPNVRESYSVPLGVENENSTYAAEIQYQKNTFDRCVQASIDAGLCGLNNVQYCNTTLSADNDVESTRSMDAERHNNRVVHSLMSITEAVEAM